ncbi:TPA: ShlB/FhaC/HecB family hemolysin secretion/activation protein, partial [Raoultella ornithinolytica]|nr:ShlB/FhaC/HecB family hemolysin secretion/activation protein [Raoultella ornithinolytica]
MASAIGLFFLLPAHAASPDDQFIIQQQRQKALEQQLTPPTPDVRLSEPSSSFGRIPFPTESPCFPIRRV